MESGCSRARKTSLQAVCIGAEHKINRQAIKGSLQALKVVGLSDAEMQATVRAKVDARLFWRFRQAGCIQRTDLLAVGGDGDVRGGSRRPHEAQVRHLVVVAHQLPLQLQPCRQRHAVGFVRDCLFRILR